MPVLQAKKDVHKFTLKTNLKYRWFPQKVQCLLFKYRSVGPFCKRNLNIGDRSAHYHIKEIGDRFRGWQDWVALSRKSVSPFPFILKSHNLKLLVELQQIHRCAKYFTSVSSCVLESTVQNVLPQIKYTLR